jgi:adenylate cyclase
MREAALKTLLRPGASEVELAHASEQLALRSRPTLGAVMEDLIPLNCAAHSRRTLFCRRESGGTLPGARTVTVCFADLVIFQAG